MAYTLFDATLDLARTLMDVFESVATGGSTTTVVDTYLNRQAGWFSDAPFGTLWLKVTTPASRIVVGHSGPTITFAPTATTVTVGDKYAVAPGIYPKYLLTQAVNSALVEMGRLPYQKQVTPTANKESYISSDDAVFAEEIVGVELSNNSTTPYYWTPHYRWHQNWLGTTPAFTFFFDEDTEPKDTNPMNIYYVKLHGTLTADADAIHPIVHPDRLKWEAAVHALRWRVQRTKTDDPAAISLLNESKEKAAETAVALTPEARERAAAVAEAQLPTALAMASQMRQAYPIQRQYAPQHAKW